MVLNLFSGAALNGHGSTNRRGRASSSLSSTGTGRRPQQQRRQASRSATDGASMQTDGAEQSGSGVRAEAAEDRVLFNNCVAQVQRHLKTHADSPSTLHTLASYYTKTEPFIEGRPFCVTLSYATFLFHMQMARISVADVELYVQLVTSVLSQITEDDQLHHPFVQQVLRDHVFGLPSPTCRGAAHSVVLLSPQQYRAFATMTTALISLAVVPLSIVYQFHDRLETYCECASPLVANRALALLVQTVGEVRMDEQVTALQYVLKTKPVKMNVDFLLACYERLKRAVIDPAHGPSFGRALSIHCSELFLRFRSPVRRDYVERFLYPSLCHSDMAGFLEIPATRKHLLRELLSQCTPGMGTMNPFYMCLCAVLQSCFDNETDGALETVALINCHMPHAAYFMSTLAVDSHMSVPMFAKVMISLARGAGMAMTGRETPDEVAASINENRTSVYNVLFLLREVVRSCSTTASRRATDMLKALRVAVAPKTIEALGKLSSEAFEAVSDITLDPQLLCAELAMVLHQDHIAEAMDSAVEYFRDVRSRCPYCAAARSSSLLCPVNSTVHVAGQASVSRVLSTLSECAGAKAVEEKLIGYLRDPALQMESAVHYLIYHIIANGGQHRNTLFVAVEPYVRSTLLALVSADRSGVRGLVDSTLKANVLMLHVKLVTLLASSIDPSYLESILKVFSELRVRNNHDALALWYMGNVLLRSCRGNLELLPTDPQENNYCVAFPGCAPASATTADNAQLVLKLLHRAHSFSPEMNKLVGCCVCKLIQDFNMQAPNICSTLLSPFGFFPVGLESLNAFALPAGAGSTFWSFFLQQMRSSAPARTAFMATLAKSLSRRFRIASPRDALAPHGVEPTGHLFVIMVYEAMKRNPPLARVLLYMVSHWMKQAGHPPGKLACLVYVCVQLITVVVDRAEGPAAAEVEAETPQDRQQFDDAVKKAARVLKSQQTRLDKLAPTARRDNIEFFHLLRRLQRRVRCTVAAASGEIVVGDEAAEECDDHDDAVDASRAGGHVRQDSITDAVCAMQELQNAADNSVFDDYADDVDHEDDGAYGNDDGACDAASPGLGRSAQTEGSGDRAEGPPAPMRIRHLPQGITSILRSPARSSPDKSDRGAASVETGSTTSVNTYREANRQIDVEDVPHDADGADAEMRSHHGKAAHSCALGAEPRTRSTSRGVQTDTSLTSPALSGHAPQRSVGTSPIQPAGTSSHILVTRRDGIQLPCRAPADAGSAHTLSSSLYQPQRSHTRPPEADSVLSEGTRTPAQRGSTWREPDLADYVDGDTTPIDDYTGVPRLQATTTSDGIVLPSGMVLEYLRTHQGMDSLQHELRQFDQQWMMQQVAEYVSQNGGMVGAAGPSSALRGGVSSVQFVTVEGRANNYSRPHADPTELAPTRTVRTEVRMAGPATSYSRPPRQEEHGPVVAAAPGLPEEEEVDVVDGEHPIRAVSGPPDDSDFAGGAGDDETTKRRRVEATEGNATTPLPPPVSPTSAFRGRNFFLNQHTQQEVSSTLQDIHYLQRRQQANMSALAKAQSAAETAESTGDDEAPRKTPHQGQSSTGVAGEGVPPTTPYGQVILPTWIVEQRNDTAIRELRQVMGAHNPNDSRLSTSAGKRSRIHGSGTGDGSGNSAAWWAEMSSAPMPNYAADPQYSMELF
ncbi:kinetoplastid kinetochore protein 1 / KKT1 [Leishmania donovani]|uniref:Kinetoplastid_kinetochore_protein_1_putative/Gene DB:LmjF.36.1900 n=1 Tax=Leishmania donovani TaxID=5661 RepID=A0A6J8FSS4_LEIDO|nr:kinetoplastid kinetochore protein 1 / KKT1 [Leishmania donovani]VDZ49384.1 kinetoplastid_kinetochore_protein_1_putative/GeneDB:LmjF.36.1900 [Leishmania donovani]